MLHWAPQDVVGVVVEEIVAVVLVDDELLNVAVADEIVVEMVEE